MHSTCLLDQRIIIFVHVKIQKPPPQLIFFLCNSDLSRDKFHEPVRSEKRVHKQLKAFSVPPQVKDCIKDSTMLVTKTLHVR